MNDTDRTPATRAGACGGNCASCPLRAPRAEACSGAGTTPARLELFPLPTPQRPSLG
jgi:hypothetical protein